MQLRSGATIYEISKDEANSKNYLTRSTLRQLHLVPDGSPVAFDYNEDGMYWSFYVGDGYALKGVDSTEIESGVEYSFRAAKG